MLITTVHSQEISVDSKNATLNDEFKIIVKINASETIGVGFDLVFDKNIIDALKVEEGDLMKKCKSTTFNIRPPIINDGKIEFQNLCFGEIVTGEDAVAIITFKAKSLGESNLVFQKAYIFDKEGDPMQNIKITNGRVIVINNSRTDSDLVDSIRIINHFCPKSNESVNNKRNLTNETYSTKTLKTLDVFVFPNRPSKCEKVEIKVFSDGEPLTNATVIYNKNTYYTNKEGVVEIIANDSDFVIVKKEDYETKEIILYVKSETIAEDTENTNLRNLISIIFIAAVLLTFIVVYKKFKKIKWDKT